MYMKPQHSKQRGFTLVELLVSLALFSIVMAISIGTLLSIIDANRKAQTMRTAIDNIHFAIESMARNIRTGYQYDCSPASAATLENCPNGGTSFRFVDDQNKVVIYSFDAAGDRLMRNYDGGGDVPLTAPPPELVIDDARFYLTGTGGTGANAIVQPTVTIVIQGHAGVLNGTESRFNLETTVTQRILDYN